MILEAELTVSFWVKYDNHTSTLSFQIVGCDQIFCGFLCWYVSGQNRQLNTCRDIPCCVLTSHATKTRYHREIASFRVQRVKSSLSPEEIQMYTTDSTNVICFGEARLLALIRCLTGHGSVHTHWMTTVLAKLLSTSETAAPLMRVNFFLSQYIFLGWKTFLAVKNSSCSIQFVVTGVCQII